jgi:hypothetical protein
MKMMRISACIVAALLIGLAFWYVMGNPVLLLRQPKKE